MGLISRVSSRTYRSLLKNKTWLISVITEVSRNRQLSNLSRTSSTNPSPSDTSNLSVSESTPKDAKTMSYVDKKCPFTGNVSIRGRLLTGVVTKLKMQRSCTVRRDYLHYIKKYQRFEKRHKMVSAHVSPCWRDIAIGDLVTIGECRPLAKTINFN